jgi:hypothetical protein
MTDRWSKLAPLTGVLFALLTVGAIVTNGESSPEANAGALKVFVYYTKHRSEVQTSAILFALAFLVLVLFAGVLRSYLRRTAAAEGLGSLVLAGAVLMAAGALVGSGVEFGLAHNIHSLSMEEARTLNFVSDELFLPVLAGGFVFGVCAGIAILRGAALPTWLGWVAIVIGIVTIVPPASMVALLAFMVWTLVVSILMYLRTGVPADAGAASALPATPQPGL